MRVLARWLFIACGSLAVAAAVPACGEAPKIVKKPKKDAKHDAKAILAEARDDAKNGDYDAADENYKDAYAITKDWDTLEERVDFLIHAGRASKAVEVAKAYYDANVSDTKGYALYAEALLAANDGIEAKTVADQLIAVNGDDPAGHEKRGRALILLEKNEEGLDELRKAVQLDSNSATYHLSLGTALSKLNKVDEAAIEFNNAIKANPDDADAYVMLAMARRMQGELDEAKEKLDKALDLDPRNGRAYFEMGLLYNQRHPPQQAEAEQALAKAVQLAPNESLFWYAYGEVFRVTQRTDEAISAYKKALALDPPYPKAMLKLGAMYNDRKEYSDAETVLTQAVRKDSKNYQAFFQLGVALAAQKKTRPALDAFEKYLSLAPKNDPDRDTARSQVNALKRQR